MRLMTPETHLHQALKICFGGLREAKTAAPVPEHRRGISYENRACERAMAERAKFADD